MFASSDLFKRGKSPLRPSRSATPQKSTNFDDTDDELSPAERMKKIREQTLAKRRNKRGSSSMLRNHHAEVDKNRRNRSNSITPGGPNTPVSRRQSTSHGFDYDGPDEERMSPLRGPISSPNRTAVRLISSPNRTAVRLISSPKRTPVGLINRTPVGLISSPKRTPVGLINRTPVGRQNVLMTPTAESARARGMELTYDPNFDEEDEEYVPPPLDIPNMRKFLVTPGPPHLVQAYIRRIKSGFKNKMFPKYEMFLTQDNQFMMSAKKKTKNKTSNYIISSDRQSKKDSAGYIGKLRSNFVGTEFMVYDGGENPNHMHGEHRDTLMHNARLELGSVMYAPNILGSRGPRKMVVCIPAIERDGHIAEWPASEASESQLITAFKAGDDTGGLLTLVNKEPKWNDGVGAYVLNFDGRVTMASVKNFQLVEEDNDETVFLQFGRVGKDLFNIDFQSPVTPLQAFAICLSSFDYKFACE